jgi:Leucine-rich repeat (LRR) protein
MSIIIRFSDNVDHKYKSFSELLMLYNYNEITYLNCRHNCITSLPDNLPNSLTYLNCSNNKLTSLPDNLPNSLTNLDCSNNNLTSLSDNLPNSLTLL